MALLGRRAFVIGPCLLAVQRQAKHRFPVHPVPCVRHAVVQLPGARHAFGDIRRVGGNSGGNDTLLHIAKVGEPQVLGRRDVAQKIRPIGRGDRAADG